MSWTIAHFDEGLAAVFAAAAAAHLAGPAPLRALYARWRYPKGFREVTGVLFALAAGLIAFPLTRIAGLAVAAAVMFLAATTLLHHRQYRYAAPVIALLFALIPFSLSATA